MTHPTLLSLLSLLSLAKESGALKKAVLSKPDDPCVLRTVLSPRQMRGEVVLQAERFLTDNKAMHENFAAADTERLLSLLEGYAQINLLTTAGDCEWRRSKSGKCTLLGGDKLKRRLESDAALPGATVEENNRKKNRILTGEEPFLRQLGISDENGRIHDKKQSKFRQINRFLELIRDCLPSLPAEGELRICDLCCGKSYLSFAVYHYFVNVLGRRVRMTGVDLKTDVIEFCNETARALSFDGLEFLAGDVAKYDAGGHVHLVISLHACDTATDLVLDQALRWEADVILSTPCCHHELNHTIQCPTLAFITDHSMLRQKLCDAATDALRLKRLQAEGYATAALELIDPEETPKNIMLRGLRRPGFDRNGREAERLKKEYAEARAFLLGASE